MGSAATSHLPHPLQFLEDKPHPCSLCRPSSSSRCRRFPTPPCPLAWLTSTATCTISTLTCTTPICTCTRMPTHTTAAQQPTHPRPGTPAFPHLWAALRIRLKCLQAAQSIATHTRRPLRHPCLAAWLQAATTTPAPVVSTLATTLPALQATVRIPRTAFMAQPALSSRVDRRWRGTPPTLTACLVRATNSRATAPVPRGNTAPLRMRSTCNRRSSTRCLPTWAAKAARRAAAKVSLAATSCSKATCAGV
mmetsp:Transcript_33618/g.60126  ORF Transcript_33618/g.60126 Transcript_33618/m.60126 type:complete len:250 (+) Transcript_33618:283-1032(+)